MKKMVFTLALLLMSLSAAMAQTWTFGAMAELKLIKRSAKVTTIFFILRSSFFT